jgi:hypothetical protein
MFLIKPFQAPTTIRSSLGFMSLATRWGEYLFPGITVLTRDVRDLKVMHDIALEVGLDGTPSSALQKFQSRESDEKIARRLKELLRKEKIEKPLAPLTQQATYWQRYGNTFNYFKLFTVRRSRDRETFTNLIFSNSPPFPNENVTARKRRVRHFKWYRDFRKNLRRLDNEHDANRFLKGSHNILRRWWLAPMPNYRNLPHAIKEMPQSIQIVRELEYALTVFQIIFESASLLSLAGAFAVPKRSNLRAGPVELVRAFLNARSHCGPAELQNLLDIALRCHETDLVTRLPYWVKKVREEIADVGDQQLLTTFHKEREISDFAKYNRRELLEELASLHVDYCNQQSKPHAVVIERFFPRPKLGPQHGRLSPDFSTSRWGMHGTALRRR